MAIKMMNPQIILYWMELVFGIICVALAGRGYNEVGIQYLITIAAGLALGNITFLLIYGFATSRPGPGRSYTKLVETVYQILACLLYCIAIGVSFNQVEYLKNFMGPITVFTSINFGTYIFGSMVAITELLCETTSAVIETNTTPSITPNQTVVVSRD